MALLILVKRHKINNNQVKQLVIIKLIIRITEMIAVPKI